MEPAVCTYLEVISFHLTKQPLLVTIMSIRRVLESVVPIQHVAREGRARSLPVKSRHFPCSLFNHAAIFFSWVVLPERSTLQNEPKPSPFLFTSAGFKAVWSRIRRGKHAISLSASEVTSSHFCCKYLLTSTLPPAFRCVVTPHPRHLTSPC